MDKQREKLTVSKDAAYEMAYGYDTNFERISKEITEQTRWSTCFRVILKRKSDGKFFESFYSKGSTESQEQHAYEYDEPVFTEVFPEKVEVIQYV